MAYIGQEPKIEFSSVPTKDSFTGDGSTVAFDLSAAVVTGAENALEVFVDNVRQEPGSGKAYTLGLDGSNDNKRITFTAAPANGAAIYVINDKSNTTTLVTPTNLGGVELILDADSDTSITADTDDQIDIKIAAADHLQIKSSSGDTVLKPMVDAKDIIFQQFDGNKIFCIDDGNFVSVGGNSAAPGEIRIYEDTDLGANYTGFKAGNLTESVAYQLPLADGSSGQALATNGSGVLSWTTIATNTPTSADGQALGSASLEWSDLFLADGAVINLGADQDVTLTHVADTGVLLNGASVIQFRDSGLTIGSNADGDLDIVSDGTAVDSINIESAGGITLDAGTAGSGVIYEDDGTEMMRIHNSSSDVIIETKVSDKDFIIKGNDGGSVITPFTLDMSAGGDLFLTGGLIDLKNDGSAVSQIKFYCESSNAHAQTLIGAPHSESATNTLTLPSSGGDAKLVSVSSTATLTNKTLTTPVIAEIDSGSTITLDATTDIVLDADGGDIFFKDDGTTFGSATNTSGNLIIKSGTTTAATFSGANVTFAGTIGSGAITSTGIVTAVGTSVFTNLDISGDVDIDGTTNLDVVDIDGALTQDGGAVFNETSADVDFRVESNGNTHMIFVDGGNDQVGIGTSSMGADVQIGFHDTATTATAMGTAHANDATLLIGGANSGTTQGSIYLGGQNISADGVAGAVYGFSGGSQNSGIEFLEGSSDAHGQIKMSVAQGTSGTLVEALKIGNNGATTITVTDNSDTLTLKSTDDDAATGPVLNLVRDSSSPADGDSIGRIYFTGDNDAGEPENFVRFKAAIVDASNGSEDGQLRISRMIAGGDQNVLSFLDGETVVNDDSKDIDFRVESDGDANAFFVEGSTDHIGMGTNDPDSPLHVHVGSAGSVTAFDTTGVTIEDSDNATLNFLSPDSGQSRILFGSPTDNVGASIKWGHDGTKFEIKGGTGSSILELGGGQSAQMTIRNGGQVGVGSFTSDNTQFFVQQQNGNTGTNGIYFQSPTSNDDTSHFIARSTRTANSSYRFFQGQSDNGSDDEVIIRGDGNAYIDGSWNGGGADYAEYFEWKDGNSSSENRIGYSVVLDNNKIVKATDSDDASKIIGVISANPAIVGDTDIGRWKQKYLLDDYNNFIMEDKKTYEWRETIETKDDDGFVTNTENKIHSYYEGEIPDDITVPDDAEVNTQSIKKLNPDWNKDTAYISREDRKEWDTVGLMGKLRLRKGQPTGTNWIKMRDISDTVEEWLIR